MMVSAIPENRTSGTAIIELKPVPHFTLYAAHLTPGRVARTPGRPDFATGADRFVVPAKAGTQSLPLGLAMK